jgi:mono/diheme cytochrome c family protein
MRISIRIALSVALLSPLALTARAASDEPSVERGLYVAKIGGCNDCHTTGYRQSSGTTPQSDWLKGTSLGEQGPWGTTYPTNLRLYMAALTEDQWVENAKTMRARPPMPWFNIQFMTETDQRSLYRFIRSLGGPPGAPAPDYVPPGGMPKTPYVIDIPQKPH